MRFSAYAEQEQQVSGIKLVSCGHIFAKPGREINRPNGRQDWLLFYIAKGNETFFLQNIQTGKAGSFILFAPGEKQHHIYTGNKTAEFYYVHFKCNNIPSDISLVTSNVYNLPFNRQICDMFEDMIEQTLQKKPFYEKLCIYKLLYLLSLLDRDVLYDSSPDKEHFDRIALAVQHMNRFYDSNYSLEDYARMCTMSKYHFIRVFEKIVGTSPLEYRNNIRMEHAAELILEEQLSIEQISSMVGFSSASYFSSAFKQKHGLSPKQYQKENWTPASSNRPVLPCGASERWEVK